MRVREIVYLLGLPAGGKLDGHAMSWKCADGRDFVVIGGLNGSPALRDIEAYRGKQVSIVEVMQMTRNNGLSYLERFVLPSRKPYEIERAILRSKSLEPPL